MGLQDWLQKATPNTALGGKNAAELSNDVPSPSGNGLEGAVTLSRFTGLPVVPTRLHLSQLSVASPALNDALPAPDPEAQQRQQNHASPVLENDPSSLEAWLQPSTPSFPQAVPIDTDDLTDFHPLYPLPSQGLSASLTPTSNAIDEAPVDFGTPNLPAAQETYEGFYVAPPEAFASEPSATTDDFSAGFAWPNTPSLPLNDHPHDAWEPASTDDEVWIEETLAPVQWPAMEHSQNDLDDFGLHEFSSSAHYVSPSAAAGLDDFGLAWDSSTDAPTDAADGSFHHNTTLQTISQEFSWDDTVSSSSSLDDAFALELEDLSPLYPLDEQALLHPTLTLEPPESSTDDALDWESSAPWPVDTLDVSPLEASPLHLLDSVEPDAFASEWSLTLPESNAPHTHPATEEDLDAATWEEPFIASVGEEEETVETLDTMDFAMVFDREEPLAFSVTDVPLSVSVADAAPAHKAEEELPAEPAQQSSGESFDNSLWEETNDQSDPSDHWQGFHQDPPEWDVPANIGIPINEDTLANTALLPHIKDEAWLHENVSDEVLTPLQPPQSNAAMPEAKPSPSSPLPLATATTKNGLMSVVVQATPNGRGALLYAQLTSNATTALHLLKQFSKNPFTENTSPLRVMEEARLKGKTLYRIELGLWRGLFSHSERQGIVFQDEWESD